MDNDIFRVRICGSIEESLYFKNPPDHNDIRKALYRNQAIAGADYYDDYTILIETVDEIILVDCPRRDGSLVSHGGALSNGLTYDYSRIKVINNATNS